MVDLARPDEPAARGEEGLLGVAEAIVGKFRRLGFQPRRGAGRVVDAPGEPEIGQQSEGKLRLNGEGKGAGKGQESGQSGQTVGAHAERG